MESLMVEALIAIVGFAHALEVGSAQAEAYQRNKAADLDDSFHWKDRFVDNAAL